MSQDGQARIDASIIIPFIIFTLVWGSTWIVIRDQLGVVPAQWSVTYRFVLAAVAMALVARWQGHSLRLDRGGMIAASRVNSGQPNFGIGLELDVIAAAVIGGASLFGGQGTVVGTLIGGFLIALIRNGSVLLNINTFYQSVIIGVIIWLAVIFDQYRRRKLGSGVE